ncbi:hypothetical protein BDI4_20075 [Burkholderia diffusa]|nr:hypothetical protein BDI4_20075 [Burkholderia diffusa]
MIDPVFRIILIKDKSTHQEHAPSRMRGNVKCSTVLLAFFINATASDTNPWPRCVIM